MPVTIRRNKITSNKDFEKQFKKSEAKQSLSSGPLYPTRVGYKGRNTIPVRFLTEPDQWVNYYQYWDPAIGRPVIQTEENEESYEERNIKPSIIHLAVAHDVDTGQLLVLELKWSLVKDIQALREKYATEAKGNLSLTDYDVELDKRGSTKEDTEYRASFAGKTPFDLELHKIPNGFTDWQDYLWKFLDRLAGNDTDDDTDDDDSVEDDTEEAAVESTPAESETKSDTPKRRVIRKAGA